MDISTVGLNEECLVNSAVECLFYTEKVGSSILSQGTKFLSRINSVVECFVANENVIGSNPISCSIIFHSSTAVVQLTVNQLVVGSIPACGASFIRV